jgi:hypothetical protein
MAAWLWGAGRSNMSSSISRKSSDFTATRNQREESLSEVSSNRDFGRHSASGHGKASVITRTH